VFFSGIFTLLAGLAIVRAHNVWSAEWTVLVTILGWLCVIGGIVRIIWPERVSAFRNNAMRSENAVTAWALIALLLGGFLTAKGYALV
jgi:glucan phosphoethanolaminetransferase (alkaline phosphatase superfamily)